MKKLFAFVVFFAAFYLAFTNTAHAAVWETQAQWNDQYENLYGEWVQTRLKNDAFSNPKSPFYGIPTDCADLIYTARALFAFENKLPFKIRNSRTTAGGFITNSETKWD